MKNKYAKVFLSLLLLCGLQQKAAAQCLRDEIVYENMVYRIDKPGTFLPTACVINPTDVVKGALRIPANIRLNQKNYRVNDVQTSAFTGQTEMTSIVLPDLDHWGTDVFADCTALREVNIPPRLTEVGHWMFRNCKSLEHIALPEGLRSIGREAFEGSGLTAVSLPDAITSVGQDAFAGTPWYEAQPDGVVTSGHWALGYKGDASACIDVVFKNGVNHVADGFFKQMERLTDLRIAEGVKSIGKEAAMGLALLGSVDLPLTLERVGDYAFSECSALSRVSLPDSLRSLGRGVFSYCEQLHAVNLPAKLDSIGRDCFRCCGLTQVVLPATLTKISAYAFLDNPLNEVVVEAVTPPVLEYDDYEALYAFDNRTLENAVLRVPEGSAAAYRSAEGWSGFAHIVEGTEPTGIETAGATRCSVFSTGGKIHVSGSNSGAPLEIFVPDGTPVYCGTARSVRVAPGRLYLVRWGTCSAKVFVR